MLDKFDRNINYLRISVTNKCNLRCSYCMPEDGIPLKQHSDFLTLEEMIEIVKISSEMGISKVRLTGGEPLVKKGIIYLVNEISKIKKIKFIGITTNGILLTKYSKDLKKAGVSRLNISLDTIDPKKYRQLTRIGNLQNCLDGIEAAKKEKIPIKINMVVFKETTDDEILKMKEFCKKNDLKLQLINHYTLSEEKMANYNFERPPDCSKCNKIRLLADGTIKPCLHSNEEIKIDLKDIKGTIKKVLKNKPLKGSACTNRNIFEIGG